MKLDYDPQRLLPDLRYTDAWYQAIWQSSPADDLAAFCKSIMGEVYQATGIADLFPKTISPDEVIDFDAPVSPTARYLSDLMTAGIDRTPRVEHKIAIIHVGADFGALEARILATLADKRVRGIVLDIESAGGEIAGNPQLDLYRQAMLLAPVEKKVAPKAPPSYLRHDPTKNVRRQRRK